MWPNAQQRQAIFILFLLVTLTGGVVYTLYGILSEVNLSAIDLASQSNSVVFFLGINQLDYNFPLPEKPLPNIKDNFQIYTIPRYYTVEDSLAQDGASNKTPIQKAFSGDEIREISIPVIDYLWREESDNDGIKKEGNIIFHKCTTNCSILDNVLRNDVIYIRTEEEIKIFRILAVSESYERSLLASEHLIIESASGRYLIAELL